MTLQPSKDAVKGYPRAIARESPTIIKAIKDQDTIGMIFPSITPPLRKGLEFHGILGLYETREKLPEVLALVWEREITSGFLRLQSA